jgi:hypothetical protein
MSADVLRREVRLIILRFLAEEENRSLTSTNLTIRANDIFIIDKGREWVEQELAYLERMGAIKLTKAGSVQVATLLAHGAKHLSWAVTIPDVLRPSERIVLPEAQY